MRSTDTGVPGEAKFAGTDGAFKETRVDYNRILDDKMAGSEAFQYHGGTGASGEKWRKAGRGYFGTKHKPLLLMIDWAEAQDENEITAEMIKKESQAWMTEYDVFRLGTQRVGFRPPVAPV